MRTIGFREVLLLVGYTLLYVITRELSLSHWLLSSGLRFSALLFLPFRYWPYILFADCAGSLYFRASHVNEYGWQWLTLSVLLPPLATAVIIAWLRLQSGFDIRGKLSTLCLQMLRTAGAVSILIALSGIVAMQAITYSAKITHPRESPVFYLCDFTLGNYLGILMFAPVAMTWFIARQKEFQEAVTEFRAGMNGFLASMSGVVAILGMLLLVNRISGSQDIQRLAAIFMLAPIVWMTFRRGWIGAISVTILASASLELTMRGYRDFEQLQSQALLGLVATGMLLLGASVTENQLRVDAIDRLSILHKRLARKNLYWGESRMRHAASIVERTFVVLQSCIDDAALHLRSTRASEAGALLRWSGTAAIRSDIQHTISTLDARPLDARGLRVALAYGPLAQTLNDAGISYSVRVGPELLNLPYDVQLILYRLTYDVALHLAREHAAYRIAARLCTYRTETNNVALVLKAWPSLGDQPKLPPGTLELEEVENLALTFNGVYKNSKRRRLPMIGVVLRDV
ncbi:hypothetical protein EO087_00055 [Dyella sp. M7H15-1]|uniref:MASE1 domain-containing protein n=1 Tax=Dyella sp. M7H15-1 TaxID=2501295 RepID=UPI0010050047|nr:MASE1 domain-containing protein [Dyella sp. M7H15-1]QAU22562.1 hypothetical protein EO087_00055 [Dyella sp. M7H15-1]